MLHALKFLSDTLDSFFRKATIAQMLLTRTGGLSAPKLGIAVILMPFFSSVPTLMEQIQLVSIGVEIFLRLTIIKQAIDRRFLEEGEAQDL